MDVPSRLSRNMAVTDQTTFVLLQPQGYQLPAPLHGILPVPHKALLEVRLPFRRVWIGFCLYFGVSVDRNITSILQSHDFTFWRYALKRPISGSVGFKILGLDPPFPSIGMASATPFPEQFPDTVIHVIKGFLGDHMSVIVGPAPNHWVEIGYQNMRRYRFMAFNHIAYLGEECLQVLVGGFYQTLPVVLANILSKEIKPIVYVCRERLLR